jgi:photosystem II stability/assembly factor-like uncharacterized protein
MKRLLLVVCIIALAVGILTATAAAQPWTKQTSPATQIMRGLKVVNAQVVWATGYLGEVVRTVDGGTTWALKTPTDATMDNYAIEALDSSTAWIYGTDDATSVGCRIWKTTNGGTSWVQQYTDNEGFGDAIKFYDANNGIAIGDPFLATPTKFQIMTTTNGGTTWTPLSNPPLAEGGETGVVNGLELIGNMAWFVTYGTGGRPAVWKSTDKGLTWTSSPRVPIDDSYGFSMRDENAGIISNINSGSVARTTDGWAHADSMLLFAGVYGLRQIDWITGTNSIVVVGGPTATGFSAVSLDGGTTWTQKTVPAGVGRLRHVQFIDAGTGWAVGNGGAILKWTDPPLVGVEDKSPLLPDGFSLSQNYPNPFNPGTTIDYAIPGEASVQLTVYDMLGREMATLVNERQPAGSYTVRFDAHNLASGVYYYTLKAGTFVSTKSLLLMK